MGRGNAVVVLALLSLTQIPVFANLPSAAIEIQNDADYVRLKQAACASQVVLTDLESDPNNRVVGVLAAIVQAAASNKNTTSSGLEAFAGAFDTYLRSASSGDANLLIPVNFITDVRFGVREARQPGMTADFGLEILQMLGIMDEGSTQEEALKKFLDSQRLDLVNDGNTNLMLTFGFMGLDAAGKPNAGVHAAFIGYLSSQGFDPFPTPAVLASSYPGVAAAMAALPPDYASMQADRVNNFAAMQAGVIQEVGTMVDSLPDMIGPAVTLDTSQRLDYVYALRNPNQADIDAVRAQRALDMQQLNQSRSEMNAKLSVMKIACGESTADQVDAVVEYVGAAAKIVSGVAGIALAIMVPSPPTIVAGIGGFADIVSGGSELFGASAANDELDLDDINNQIIDMRQQMQDMQTQLNHRFDAVDATLDEIFLHLGDVTLELDSIRDGVYELQSNLDRMNQRLFGAFLADYQQPFFTTLNSAIGYKSAHFGYDMAFMTETESFSVFENSIQMQATENADVLAGPEACDLTVDSADTDLEVDNYGYNINNLRQFPSAVGWGQTLHPSRVSNPTVWATAANAYAELCRENPWYHAMYRADPGQQSRLDDVKIIGEEIEDVLKDFGNRPFITRLVEEHGGAQEAFAGVADYELNEVLKSGFPYRRVGDDLSALNIWGSPAQSVASWPVPQVSVYKLNSDLTQGTQLTGWRPDLNDKLPVGSNFLQSTVFANQHNLGVNLALGQGDTLTACIAAVWFGKRYEYVFPTQYNCFASPWTWVFIYHHDASNGRTWLYSGPDVVGQEIKVGWIYVWEPLDDNPLWTNSLHLVYENWVGGQRLCDQTLTYMQPPFPWDYSGGQARLDAVTQCMQDQFDDLQTQFYDHMLSQLASPLSNVANAAGQFSSLQALLEGYVSLAYPQSMSNNQLLHGMLRGSGYQFTEGVVRSGSMAIDANAVEQVYADAEATHPPAKPDIEAIFGARLNALQAELDTIAPSDSTYSSEMHPFLKYALANITYAGAMPLQLANDETYVYTAGGPALTVPASDGVLANDAPCPNVLDQDYAYEVDALFVGASQTGGPTTQGGTVTFDADGQGGFTYSPPDGFSGMDTFQYQARGQFVVNPVPLLSNTATVYISVVSGPPVLTQPQDVTVVAGQPAVMQVGVADSPWLLCWRKNGMPLYDDGRIVGTQTDTLVISSTEVGDAGNYDIVFSLPGSPSYVSDSAALTVLPGSIPDVKRSADTVVAEVLGCVVTRVWPDFFYVQTPYRSAGIQVRRTAHGVSTGDVVALRGNIYTDEDEERFVSASAIFKIGTGPAEPLALTNRAIGGADAFSDLGNGQRGIVDGVGLNNVGLLIRACGEVTYTDPGGLFFDVWDGSTYQSGIAPIDPQGAEGVRVSAAGMALPSPGDFVVVTGISSLRQDDSTILPEILVSDEADICPQ